MSYIFRAEQLALRRSVAIKVIMKEHDLEANPRTELGVDIRQLEEALSAKRGFWTRFFG